MAQASDQYEIEMGDEEADHTGDVPGPPGSGQDSDAGDNPRRLPPGELSRILLEKFAFIRTLGRGGYGEVTLVRKRDGADKGVYYAQKTMLKSKFKRGSKDLAHVISERNVLEELNHPFINRLHYAFHTAKHIALIMTYCAGGELYRLLEEKTSIPADWIRFYASELVVALGYLHGKEIAYRDLKPENILLMGDGHIQLADFGLCKEVVTDDEDKRTGTYCGTLDYMAPETVRRGKYGSCVDWWGLGVVCFDMYHGYTPFASHNKEVTTRKILKGKFVTRTGTPDSLISFLNQTIKVQDRHRLGYGPDGYRKVQKHCFFASINWDDVGNRKLIPPYVPILRSASDTSQFDPAFTKGSPKYLMSERQSSTPSTSELFAGYSYTSTELNLPSPVHGRIVSSPDAQSSLAEVVEENTEQQALPDSVGTEAESMLHGDGDVRLQFPADNFDQPLAACAEAVPPVINGADLGSNMGQREVVVSSVAHDHGMVLDEDDPYTDEPYMDELYTRPDLNAHTSATEGSVHPASYELYIRPDLNAHTSATGGSVHPISDEPYTTAGQNAPTLANGGTTHPISYASMAASGGIPRVRPPTTNGHDRAREPRNLVSPQGYFNNTTAHARPAFPEPRSHLSAPIPIANSRHGQHHTQRHDQRHDHYQRRH